MGPERAGHPGEGRGHRSERLTLGQPYCRRSQTISPRGAPQEASVC